MKKYIIHKNLIMSYRMSIDSKYRPKFNRKMFRIQAIRSFGDVSKGDFGGYISSEDNLDHDGNCWIYDDAVVVGNNPRISGNASVRNNVVVMHKAVITGNAVVSDEAYIIHAGYVDGNARVSGKTEVSGYVTDNAIVGGRAIIGPDCTIYDHGQVIEYGIVSGMCTVGDYGIVSNTAWLRGGINLISPINISGNIAVSGTKDITMDLIDMEGEDNAVMTGDYNWHFSGLPRYKNGHMRPRTYVTCMPKPYKKKHNTKFIQKRMPGVTINDTID